MKNFITIYVTGVWDYFFTDEELTKEYFYSTCGPIHPFLNDCYKDALLKFKSSFPDATTYRSQHTIYKK